MLEALAWNTDPWFDESLTINLPSNSKLLAVILPEAVISFVTVKLPVSVSVVFSKNEPEILAAVGKEAIAKVLLDMFWALSDISWMLPLTMVVIDWLKLYQLPVTAEENTAEPIKLVITWDAEIKFCPCHEPEIPAA